MPLATFGRDLASRVLFWILCFYSGIMLSNILSRHARKCFTERLFTSKLVFIALTVEYSKDTILDS